MVTSTRAGIIIRVSCQLKVISEQWGENAEDEMNAIRTGAGFG